MSNDWFFEKFDEPYKKNSYTQIAFSLLIGLLFFGSLILGVWWAV